jgi:DNA-binding CsgD family transcriptional regulator/tetratricopeptide (TPR) repeat protein
MGLAGVAAGLSGRSAERAALLQVVRAALEGRPQTVVLHGEAGVGKTALVRSVVDDLRAEGVQVLWGQGLRFGAVDAMYHPLVLALEGWLADGDRARRHSLAEAVPSAALILPSLGAPPPEGRSGLVTVVDALLGHVVAGVPTVLVVDDVHWADAATWDALSYLVAGFTRQPLVLVTTHRDEGVHSDDFQRWLANLRRLPGVQEQALARLDLQGTADQVAQLLGGPPPDGLVEQVYARSRGNPYFSELLVGRGDLESDTLPPDLPDELSQAMLDAWRALSPGARELTRVLAVGGRPTDAAVLAAVVTSLGAWTVRSLREAVEAGVVVTSRDGVWFQHPLLADVLVDAFLPGEAAPIHAAWADHLQAQATRGIDQLRLLGDLATHQERAGAEPKAFATLLDGVRVATELGAHRESAELLTRAAEMWDAGAPDTGDDRARAELLERAGQACWVVDDVRRAVRLLEQATELVDPSQEPLWACRLALILRDLLWSTGELDETSQGDIEALVELSRADTDSREHADALSALAESLEWREQVDGARLAADEAVAAAHRSASAAALTRAYGVRSAIALDRDVDQAGRDAAASWEHATASGDPNAIFNAYLSRIWVAEAKGDIRTARDLVREWYEWSRPLGPAVLLPVAMSAVACLHEGRLGDAKEVLRSGLATTGSPNHEALVRLQAAVLAARQGADEAARGHVARARELIPHLENRPLMGAVPQLAELHLAWGDPGGALALIGPALPVNAVDSRSLDLLLVWGARVIADLVERARDDRDEEAVRRHLQSMDGLVGARAELPGVPFARRGETDIRSPALAALFAAERGRAEGRTDQVELWRDAVAACAAAGSEWERQLATWRLAAALVASGHPAAEAGGLLRSVHHFAGEQGALPLARRVEDLARIARISLAEPRRPAPDSTAPSAPAAFAGLTAREAEILGHLVADRTYSEIAAALFISEKTVSVHVSNLLRKTGCTSRREVAALAARLGWSGPVSVNE